MERITMEGRRYDLLRLLGKGKGGYSYLAARDGALYVLKQIHHEPCDYYAFGDKLRSELDDYRRLVDAGIRVPALCAVDRENERILKAYIEGPTVMELLRRGESVEAYLPQVRRMAARAMAAGLNIDYYPTNFVAAPDGLWYIDYECNAYMPEWDFEHWGVKYWSETPETETLPESAPREGREGDMTTVYFVRHAQPLHGWADDATRPLTAEGLEDRALVLDFLKDKPVDAFYSSPYRRSADTIAPAAAHFGLPVHTDPRFRERQAGPGGNGMEMFRRRWADFGYCEPGGECLRDVQARNVAALFDVLDANPGKTVVIGTHGTALSALRNRFDASFGCEAFLRIIDWMPFILEARFEGRTPVAWIERGHVLKVYRG